MGRLGKYQATGLFVISRLTRMVRRPNTTAVPSLEVQCLTVTEREGQKGEGKILPKKAVD